jgi:hypothetical protein
VWLFMKPKLLSLNLRGLKDTHLRFMNLIRQWKATTICLQESKLSLFSTVLCIVCGVVNTWNGVIQLRFLAPFVFSFYDFLVFSPSS